MKSSYLVILIIIILLGALAYLFLTQKVPSKSNPAMGTAVLMKEDKVEPENLTVKKGTTVSFKNEDKVARWPASNIHPTHTIYPEFDPQKPIQPGEFWSITFEKVGEWKYHDHLIPSIRGKIIVTE